MVTLSFTIFSGQKNYNRAHMLFQVLCGFEPIFYTTHPNEEPKIIALFFSFTPVFSFRITNDEISVIKSPKNIVIVTNPETV